jgi:hypothetical protein
MENVLNNDPSNGCKGVPIVKTEGGELVTATTDFQGLPEGEGDETGFFPNTLG